MLSWGAAAATSVDAERLVAALAELIASPGLRRRMGAAGQAHARAIFDWSHVYAAYGSLWAELDARRRTEGGDVQTPRSGGQLEPFTAFASYPTRAISGETTIALRPEADPAAYRVLAGHALYPGGAAAAGAVAPLWGLLEQGPLTAAAAAEALGRPLRSVVNAAGVLAKMGFVTLGPG
ncbi:glycosyltransferase [Phenylobacterium zucineum]|uniref:glycosyltransferase n=1 Tax=Phenylobacterium zucineum TaxID=284016 RepID=UPI00059C649E|nr:hypothetical protein [Phenylobacterium zucineum]